MAEAPCCHLKVKALAVRERTRDQRDKLLWICSLDRLPGTQRLLPLRPSESVVPFQGTGGSLIKTKADRVDPGAMDLTVVGTPNLPVACLPPTALGLTSWFHCSSI